MFAYPLIFKNAVPPSKKHICRKLNGSSSTPKNFLHKGPQKKKRRPNPTQSCLCAAPQLKLNL